MLSAVERGPRAELALASKPNWRRLPSPDEWNKIRNAIKRMEHLGIENHSGRTQQRYYCRLLSACGDMRALAEGERLHQLLVKNGVDPADDEFLGTNVVSMYASCGRLDKARELFHRMHNQGVVAWTLLIKAFAQKGQNAKAIEMFRNMLQLGVSPDKLTVVRLVGTAAGLGGLKTARWVHAVVNEIGYGSEVVVTTALLSMYSKCNSMVDVEILFDLMPEKDAVSWTTVVNASVEAGHPGLAVDFFRRMLLEGENLGPASIVSGANASGDVDQASLVHSMAVELGIESETVVGTALVNMYGRCGRPEQARALFESIPRRDVVLWTAMIGAYVQLDCRTEAFKLFDEMKAQGLRPSGVTYLTLASACSCPAALTQARLVHAAMVESSCFFDLVNAANAVVTMYGRCGSLEEAYRAFEVIASKRDVVTWNAMIEACIQNGRCDKAVAVFIRMVQDGCCRPDHATFTSLLTMCSHAGSVKQGCQLFVSMWVDHGLKPAVEHYSCVVDMLGRAGRLQEAESFVAHMPVRPDAGVWASLMGGCNSYGDVGRAKSSANVVLTLDPASPEAYLVLSNSLRTE